MMSPENECFSHADPDEPFADRQNPVHLAAFACPYRKRLTRQSTSPDFNFTCNHPSFDLSKTLYASFCPVYNILTQADLDKFLQDSNLEMPPLVSTEGKKCYRVFANLTIDHPTKGRLHFIQPGGRFETVAQALEYAHQVSVNGNVWIAEEYQPAHVEFKPPASS